MPRMVASRRAALAALLTTGMAMAAAPMIARTQQLHVWDTDSRLRVLTLNVWGLPISPDRAARIERIAAVLAEGAYDVVSLQEVWLPADARRLSTAAEAGGLAHAHRFKAGLLLLSRYPITNAAFTPYSLNGDPLVADHYVQKGIATATLAARFGALNVVNTHAIAQHADNDARDPYLAHRQAQMAQLGLLIREQFSGEPVLVMGDLNVRPDQLSYRALLALADLYDTFALLRPGEPGVTYDEANPYNVGKRSRRLDYVLATSGDRMGLNAVAGGLALAEPPSSSLPAYSDHYGVAAEFEVTSGDASREDNARGAALVQLLDALRVGREAARRVALQHATRAAAGSAIALGVAVWRQQWRSRSRTASSVLAAGSGVSALYAGFEGWSAGTHGARAMQAFDLLIDQLEAQAG